MNTTPIDKRFRSRLRMTRLLNAYLPLKLMRFLVKKGVDSVKLPETITREELFADGVRCELITPQNCSNDKILLYFHGGGFVLGLTSLHLEMLVYLVNKMEIKCLIVDYRIAPEFPFPCSLDDCVTSYRWLVKNNFQPDNIVFAGDSAGGNLAITTIMKLRDEGDQLPAAIACLSPVADMNKEKDTYKIRYDPVLHPRASKRYHNAYVGKNDPKNPLISPVYGEMKDFPPLLIHTGEHEILKDDAVQIEQKASNAGIAVELEVYPGMWHVWQIYPSLIQTTDSLNKISTFLKAYLA